MRWLITDRNTGEVLTFANPSTFKEREALKSAIKHRSTLAVKGGPLAKI